MLRLATGRPLADVRGKLLDLNHDGGKVEDLSKGAYDRSIGPSKEEMDMARAIRDIPSKLFRGAKRAFGMEPAEGSVTKTERSVTVTPGKKRGGKVC